MARYEVEVQRDIVVTYHAFVEVEADDEFEALDEAVEACKDLVDDEWGKALCTNTHFTYTGWIDAAI